MSLYLGIDTSNYTTSAALYDSQTNTVTMERRPLCVPAGEKGLRQSDALFQHIKNLPPMLEDLLSGCGGRIEAIAASVRPRDAEGSYMPCFEAGHACARSMSAALKIPFYDVSHQAGHIAAALFSINRLELLNGELIAFHISGGTTEAVLCSPGNHSFQTKIIARSLDLKAGQAIDRVGVMLGLPFPAGPGLEKLAAQSGRAFRHRPSFKGMDCCLSGIENICAGMLRRGEDKCDIARCCLSFIEATLDEMIRRVRDTYPSQPLVFAGGVMSNAAMRECFARKYGAIFAKAEYASDNAAGVAVLASLKEKQP